jgi:hypothetical protein
MARRPLFRCVARGDAIASRLAHEEIMASPPKGRSRVRDASVGAILGATAAFVPASCVSEDAEAPPIDYDAAPDHFLVGADVEADSTLVDLDGEADAAYPPISDASRDGDAARPLDGASGRGGGNRGGTGSVGEVS